MVLQDLGRRINAAVNDMTRSSNLDEKVPFPTMDPAYTDDAGIR